MSECPTLRKANESRRRASNDLQRFRKVLAEYVDDPPPPAKPRDFEAEGSVLLSALERALAEPWRRLAALEKAVDELKPYLSNTKQDGTYPVGVLALKLCPESATAQCGQSKGAGVTRMSQEVGRSEHVTSSAGGRCTPFWRTESRAFAALAFTSWTNVGLTRCKRFFPAARDFNGCLAKRLMRWQASFEEEADPFSAMGLAHQTDAPDAFRWKSEGDPRGMHSLLSLFSGCGGFDLGFQSAGFQTGRAFDLEPIAVANFRRNVAPHADVVDLNREFPIGPSERFTLLTAGPPCQGFSTVGRRDPNDCRNDLLPLAGALGLRVRPQVMVVENVAAALSGEHARHWEALDDQLRTAGYWTHTLKWNALDFGMAQQRRRLFLLAWLTRREANFQPPKLSPARLDAALFGVENLPNHNPKPLASGSRLQRIAERIGPGQKLSNVRGGVRSVHSWHIPEVFGSTTAAECAVLETVMRLRRQERRRTFGDADPVSISRLQREIGQETPALVFSLLEKGYLRKIGRRIDLVHTFNGKCRRFRWEDAACTVDTRFGDPHLMLHPNECRPFTVREAARIQGFPDSYVFHGTEKEQFRLIGNAVPPPMARAVARVAINLLGL